MKSQYSFFVNPCHPCHKFFASLSHTFVFISTYPTRGYWTICVKCIHRLVNLQTFTQNVTLKIRFRRQALAVKAMFKNLRSLVNSPVLKLNDHKLDYPQSVKLPPKSYEIFCKVLFKKLFLNRTGH